jgi:Cyclic nucleotide-binding domain
MFPSHGACWHACWLLPPALSSALSRSSGLLRAPPSCINRVSRRILHGPSLAAASPSVSIAYYFIALFLDHNGAAIRNPTRFREYALGRKQQDARETIRLLSKCALLRHLPAEEVEQILPCVRTRHLESGEILFQAGDPPDALYIVARGKVDVLSATSSQHPSGHAMGEKLAELGEGQAFGEMALLSGEPRTATIQSVAQTDLLEIGKEDCGWPWCSRWYDRSKNIRWKNARKIVHRRNAR